MRIICKLICENYDVENHKYIWCFEGERFHLFHCFHLSIFFFHFDHDAEHGKHGCCWPWIWVDSIASHLTFHWVFRSHSSPSCYTNNDCIITWVKSITLMCETHVKLHTKACRTFNKITPRFKMKNTFMFNSNSEMFCDYFLSLKVCFCLSCLVPDAQALCTFM